MMTDHAKHLLDEVTGAVADASEGTTPLQRLRHLLSLAEAELGVLTETVGPAVWLTVLKHDQTYEFETDCQAWVRHRGELYGPTDPLPCGGTGADVILLGRRFLRSQLAARGMRDPGPGRSGAADVVAERRGTGVKRAGGTGRRRGPLEAGDDPAAWDLDGMDN